MKMLASLAAAAFLLAPCAFAEEAAPAPETPAAPEAKPDAKNLAVFLLVNEDTPAAAPETPAPEAKPAPANEDEPKKECPDCPKCPKKD